MTSILEERRAHGGAPLRIAMVAFVTATCLAACGQAAAPTPTAPPVPSLVPSLTSTATAEAGVEGTPIAETTDDGPTVTPIVVTLEPLLGEHIEPPIDITLPDGWQIVGYDAMVLGDVDTIRGIPLAVYSGPVTGGTGTIVLLWGFPSLVPGNPLEGSVVTPQPDLWADGLRLLRLAILEQGCNVGTDLRRDYRVGLDAAVGTQFSAVDCPDQMPNTRGWFAGLNEGGLNFVFYVYTNPIDAMTDADEELQAILDTVRFHVPQ